MSRNSRSRFASRVACAHLAALAIFAAPVHAGDRQLEVLIVNMTPDAESGADSSKCVESIRKVFKDDYAFVKKLGETKTRKLVGEPKGGAHFLTWKAEQFKTLKEGSIQQTYLDTVVLIDCRPQANLLDVLVVPASNQSVGISVRRASLDKKLLDAVAERARSRSWDGFVP